jgi:lipopolysaccharide export system protein LptC
MARRDNFHSRLVAWMKIILPLAALGLLSTLFLLSRKVDLSDAIPYSTIDLEQRAHDQGATNPAFAGVAVGGERVSFKANIVRPVEGDLNRLVAEDVRAELRLNSGAVVTIESQRGETDQAEYMAVLEGDARITTTTGYDIRTDRLTVRFDRLRAESPGPVTGTGPPGTLSAGRMVLTTDGKTPGTAHLLFTDGVKLIYTLPDPED